AQVRERIRTPSDFAPAVLPRCARMLVRAWFATPRMTQICWIAGDLPRQAAQKRAAARKLLA
ncbi:MAG TPA: hypothetical protein VGC79_37630, partial [Polyangiaceae bacterium]